MPRRPRLATGGLAYHVLNRRIGRLPLFEKPGDYLAFEKILREAHERTWLLDQGQRGCILISSSDPIPTEDTDLPPHRQAAQTYRDTIRKNDGDRFEVTMEHPNTKKPKPVVIEIGAYGAKLIKTVSGGSIAITSKPSPRAG